ncbi:MAG: OmpA family protein [Fuerstiella sp.]
MLCSTLILSGSGCCLIGPRPVQQELAASQLRSQELFAQSQAVESARAISEQGLMSAQQQIDGLAQQNLDLQTALGESGQQLATANTRIDNLLAERTELKNRYASKLQDTDSDIGLFTGTAPDVPGFQYDELTGLNKFNSDVLFDLGSVAIRPEAMPVLREFADNLSSGTADGLRVLIVGHTDDQSIVRPVTARNHPTNWHLSTDRANEVIMQLEKLGVSPERMSAMGYSRFQPLEDGTEDSARQRNRRVEMYIIPESSQVAKWDPFRAIR